MRRFRFVPLFSTLTTLTALVLACSSKAPLVAAGGACQLATDCDNGLICAPAKGATTCPCTCTSDLSGVQQLPPNPDAGGGATPPANKDAAAAPGDSASPTPTPEASTGGG